MQRQTNHSSFIISSLTFIQRMHDSGFTCRLKPNNCSLIEVDKLSWEIYTCVLELEGKTKLGVTLEYPPSTAPHTQYVTWPWERKSCDRRGGCGKGEVTSVKYTNVYQVLSSKIAPSTLATTVAYPVSCLFCSNVPGSWLY